MEKHQYPHRSVEACLILILGIYLVLLVCGLPQEITAQITANSQNSSSFQHNAHIDTKDGGASPVSAPMACPPFWMILPFALLLVAIAILPLISFVSHWWESNLHKLQVAGCLSLLTLGYYLLIYHHPVLGHWPVEYLSVPASQGMHWNITFTVLSNAMLNEYLPFIILLFSLYTITGAIRIEGDLPAHSLTNTVFLAAGAILASLIGTTGAAMLLIRPLLETNRQRKHVRHTVIIFIFVVCNCGGCLLPLGDPPLFLGYLFGVPFLWTLRLWPAWLFVNGSLLTIYFLWDHFWCYPRENPRDIQRDESERRPFRFRGLCLNTFLLVGVILSVALLDPAKPLPGTLWHPWAFIREAVQLALVLISLLWSEASIRRDNNFNYSAILEVGVLFFGIFICMQAPLQILHIKGASLGLSTPAHFFWASGSLSSVLDNAPTYAVYFETARSLGGDLTVAGVKSCLLAAISLGSVFMGAMTYIGNGPNFMVKSIAEKAGVAMPNFFHYVAYSAAILLPIFLMVTLLFL
jgi:Na+/H+ antiporter NhaD/arsenite permease-like protein